MFKFIVAFGICLNLVNLADSNTKINIENRLKECSTIKLESFDSCLIQLLDDTRPYLSKGIPRLNIPVLEPIFWDKLEFSQKNGSVDIHAQFNNVLVHGFSDFSLRQLRTNLQKGELRLEVLIPLLNITGDYVIDGKVFFKIFGSGAFNSEIMGIEARMVSEIVVKNDAGKERLGVQNTRINFRFKKATSKLNNLFNGDEVLGEVANRFLNTNDQMILNELKPFLSKSISDLIGGIMDQAIGAIPVSALPPAQK